MTVGIRLARRMLVIKTGWVKQKMVSGGIHEQPLIEGD
jgi:hypothetical protein